MKLPKLFRRSKANPHDKSCKLPKYKIVGYNKKDRPILKLLWVKGKSKFLHIRLFEEGKDNFNQL